MDMDKIIFSDAKLFAVEAICNRQNDQVLEKSFADVSDFIAFNYGCIQHLSVV